MTKEISWDKLLKIKTTGRDDSQSNQYNYPYEPTPYEVLERLANSGYIGKKDVLLDYGCGKGRVEFFLSYQTRTKTLGLEYDERIFKVATDNLKNAVNNENVGFLLCKAQEYEVATNINRFYFFNPFSVEILGKVISKILMSYYTKPREMVLFFYYPSDEYIAYLMNVNELEFADEIDCSDICDGERMRERILIFKLTNLGR